MSLLRKESYSFGIFSVCICRFFQYKIIFIWHKCPTYKVLSFNVDLCSQTATSPTLCSRRELLLLATSLLQSDPSVALFFLKISWLPVFAKNFLTKLTNNFLLSPSLQLFLTFLLKTSSSKFFNNLRLSVFYHLISEIVLKTVLRSLLLKI